MAKKNKADASNPDAPDTDVETPETDAPVVESLAAYTLRVIARAKCAKQIAFPDGFHAYRGGEIETDPRRVEVLKSMPEWFDIKEIDSDEHLKSIVESERSEFERLRAMCAAHGFIVHRHGDRCPE